MRAIKGTDSCRTHSGYQLKVAKVRGQVAITAWSAYQADGAPTVGPSTAVLGMLQMSWLRVAAYGEMLRQQVVSEESPDPDRDGLQHGTGEHGHTSGLVGHKYGAAGKDGHIFATGEEIRALVLLEASERDRVVKYAKTAHDMGISERLTKLTEQWGDLVASRITKMLDGLDLTPEQEARLPVLVQSHLGSFDLDDISARPENT